MSVGNILIALLMMGTLGVLIAGVVLMSAGGKANAKYTNRLMAMRVTLQAAAIALIVLLFMAGGK